MTSDSRSSADPSAPPGVSETVLASIEAHLRQRELRREELHEHARRLRRLAQGTMTRLHGSGSAPVDVAKVRKALGDLTESLGRDGRSDASIALDAIQEAVEACLLGAIVDGAPLPGPSDLAVDPEPYLLGFADVIGEVRRRILDRLGADDLTAAEASLALMERLTEALLRFDTTRAIVQLKPKQDVARTLLERTRGEVVMAQMLARSRPGRTGEPR